MDQQVDEQWDRAGARIGAETLAGYHLIRRIGTGSSSEVFLARPPEPGGVTVALKVFGRAAAPAAIDRQIRGLVGAGPAVLVGLRDTATTADGRVCLVLDHLPGPSLDRLLAARGRIAAAEVVTIAATVTASLQVVHEAGLSHSLVRPECIRFDGRGRPVLLGLGALVDLPEGAAGVPLRRDAAVGLAGFVRILLDYLDPADPGTAGAPALLAEFEAATVARPFPSTLTGLEAALFAWATAGPVRDAVYGAVHGAVHGAIAESPLPGSPAAPVPVSPPVPPVAAPWARVGLIPALRRRMAGFMPRHRIASPPVVLGLGLAVVLLVAGLTVVPVLRPAPTGAAPVSSATEPAEPGKPGESAKAVPGADADRTIIEADDPAAAVLVLLRRRDECLAAASVLCLDDVDQPGSVVMADDGYRIRQRQAAQEPASTATEHPAMPVTAELRERTGNAALVVLGATGGSGVNAQPASALVIKGEAGWRLRELFDY
ncbi:serine/threonine-protein kinase [Cryobacterium sp. SO2]|uniref:serine/threonine-protein kinase n=1 Tax=Cryobacterium sp. SO2 TaxID=1897060 RepID=UPI00223DC8F5|nr:serine/threonine-protein kinase [Cryobacterium sp. SO2]WEO79150.1 serine/threonine-protein kinase [Cryobacterium sp. SO2]